MKFDLNFNYIHWIELNLGFFEKNYKSVNSVATINETKIKDIILFNCDENDKL